MEKFVYECYNSLANKLININFRSLSMRLDGFGLFVNDM